MGYLVTSVIVIIILLSYLTVKEIFKIKTEREIFEEKEKTKENILLELYKKRHDDFKMQKKDFKKFGINIEIFEKAITELINDDFIIKADGLLELTETGEQYVSLFLAEEQEI